MFLSPVTSCKGFFYVLNGRLGGQVYLGDPYRRYGMRGLRASQTRAAISGGVGYGNPKLPAKAPRIHGNHIL